VSRVSTNSKKTNFNKSMVLEMIRFVVFKHPAVFEKQSILENHSSFQYSKNILHLNIASKHSFGGQFGLSTPPSSLSLLNLVLATSYLNPSPTPFQFASMPHWLCLGRLSVTRPFSRSTILYQSSIQSFLNLLVGSTLTHATCFGHVTHILFFLDSSPQKLKLMMRGGQFIYTPTNRSILESSFLIFFL
jgi:hypothetical protein